MRLILTLRSDKSASIEIASTVDLGKMDAASAARVFEAVLLAAKAAAKEEAEPRPQTWARND